MRMLDRYVEAASSALGEVAATQGQALEEAARLVAASVAAGGVLHLFGAGHSQLLALDAYARAGGLACVHPILDPALSPAAGLEVGAPRHSSGARLHQLADVIIDNRCPPGDAALELASGTRVAPLTTVVGTAVVAALCALVAELLEQQGHTLPVLASQNLDGPSVADDNVALMARYADRAGEGAP
jgi:uncharacterized phosphosugar-binding protein